MKDPLLDEFEGRCVKIYNPADKSLIGVYQNYKRASNKLHVHPATLRQKAKSKRRVFCETLGMEIAVRVSALGSKEEELISLTNKNGTLLLTTK
jgi:hypothetical protein